MLFFIAISPTRLVKRWRNPPIAKSVRVATGPGWRRRSRLRRRADGRDERSRARTAHHLHTACLRPFKVYDR